MKLNIVYSVITVLFILTGCSPSGAQQTVKQASAKQEAIQGINNTPNVFLTIDYDEAEVLPKPDELTILIDNHLIQAVAVDNKFNLYLDPGSYDIQISSDKRSAARGKITVTENFIVQQSYTLKTEAWSLLGDYNISLIGLSESGALDIKNGFSFGVYDAEGKLLPFDHISMISVTRIEDGSFVENAGGFVTGPALLIQDMFSTKGRTASIVDAANLLRLSNTIETGEYVVEMSLWDSENDKSYADVTFFRFTRETE